MDPNQTTQTPLQTNPAVQTPQAQVPVQPSATQGQNQTQPIQTQAPAPIDPAKPGKSSNKTLVLLLIVLFVLVALFVVFFLMGQPQSQAPQPTTQQQSLPPTKTQEEQELESIDSTFNDSELKEVEKDLQNL